MQQFLGIAQTPSLEGLGEAQLADPTVGPLLQGRAEPTYCQNLEHKVVTRGAFSRSGVSLKYIMERCVEYTSPLTITMLSCSN